jgi:hypothetical protein
MSAEDLVSAAHAMKVTGRANRVRYLSVTFTLQAASQSGAFREQLRRALARQIKQVGRFVMHEVAGRADWFIEFSTPCDERLIDRVLREIANGLSVLIYIEPGIPEYEMTTGVESFFFSIHRRRRRPSN